MAQARTTSHSSTASEANIGTGTRVRGKITGNGNLTVEGQVEGEVTVRGTLTIAAGGAVTSDVDAQSVRVSGTLEGDVNATGEVHIARGAHVRGDVKGSEISIDDGADFTGRLDCDFTLPPELEQAVKALAQRETGRR